MSERASISISAKVYERFQAACNARGVTMGSTLEGIIDRAIASGRVDDVPFRVYSGDPLLRHAHDELARRIARKERR